MRWLFIFLISTIVLYSFPLQAQQPDEYGEVTSIPRADIDHWLKNEITASDGNIVTGRYHFVLAFSTGHYGFDPLHAIAMRRIAFQLINNTCCPGDQLTTAGWEMGVWKISNNILLEKGVKGRATFVNAVPYTSRAGSQGGHDIERSVVEIINTLRQQAAPLSSSIILMITNGASQLPIEAQPGAALLGEDSQEFQDTLSSAGFRSPVRQEFTANTKKGQRNILLVAIVPNHLQTLDPSAGKRYPTFPRETWQPREDMPNKAEKLPNTVIAKKKSVDDSRTFGEWLFAHRLLALLIIIASIIILVLVIRKRTHDPDNDPEPKSIKGKIIPGTLTLSLNGKQHSFNELLNDSIFEVITGNKGIIIESIEDADNINERNVNKLLLTLRFKRLSDKQYHLFIIKEEDCIMQAPAAPLVRVELTPNEWMLAVDNQAIVKFRPTDITEYTRLTITYDKA